MKQLLFLAIFVIFITGCDEKIFVYYYPGSFQAIGDKNKLYIFLQIDRIVKRGYSVSDAPTKYRCGHRQLIIVVDRQKGFLETIELHKSENNKDGVTFHPNISFIFRYNNNFYILKGGSKNYYRSLFKWNIKDKRFILLPRDNGNKILKLIGIKENDTYGDVEDKLKSCSLKEGWNFYHSKIQIEDESTLTDKDKLKWENLELTVSMIKRKNDFDLKIQSNRINDDVLILNFAYKSKIIDKNIYDSYEIESGHAKPWYKSIGP